MAVGVVLIAGIRIPRTFELCPVRGCHHPNVGTENCPQCGRSTYRMDRVPSTRWFEDAFSEHPEAGSFMLHDGGDHIVVGKFLPLDEWVSLDIPNNWDTESYDAVKKHFDDLLFRYNLDHVVTYGVFARWL